MLSAKNPIMSAAVSDLGLGDALEQQVDDATAEKKKKLLKMAQGVQADTGGLGLAVQTLFPGLGA